MRVHAFTGARTNPDRNLDDLDMNAMLGDTPPGQLPVMPSRAATDATAGASLPPPSRQ